MYELQCRVLESDLKKNEKQMEVFDKQLSLYTKQTELYDKLIKRVDKSDTEAMLDILLNPRH